MESLSMLKIDPTYIKQLEQTLFVEYRLSICSISETNRSFERALSVCLFGNEDEFESISQTLNSHCDRASDESSNDDACYIRLAAEIYGISIHVHLNNSIKLFEMECDCPIIHLIKLHLKDGSYIYLGTEKVDEDNEIDDTIENDQQFFDVTIQDDEQGIPLEACPRSKFQTTFSLNVTVRKMKSDGNCFFRALSDQLCGCEEGHLVLRQLIMDYICENREKFEASIDQQHFSTWEDFTYKMRQRGTFADGAIVAASALS